MVKISFKSAAAALLLSSAIVTPTIAVATSNTTTTATQMLSETIPPELAKRMEGIDSTAQQQLLQINSLINQQKELKTVYDGLLHAYVKKPANPEDAAPTGWGGMKNTPSSVLSKIQKNNAEIRKLLVALPDNIEALEILQVPQDLSLPTTESVRQLEDIVQRLHNGRKAATEIAATLKTFEAEIDKAKSEGYEEVAALEGEYKRLLNRFEYLRISLSLIRFDILMSSTPTDTIIAFIHANDHYYNYLNDVDRLSLLLTSVKTETQKAVSRQDTTEVVANSSNSQNTAGQNQGDSATDSVDRLSNIPKGPLGTGTKVYNLTIDGRQMTLFVNYDTGNVVGYGYTGIGGAGVAPITASGMDYAQGVFAGKLSADHTQIIGEFSSITGASAFDNKFHVVSVPGHDATSVRIQNLPLGAFTSGGSGSVNASVSIGVGGGGFNRTLSYTTSQGATDPYKLGNYNLTGSSSGVPVAYEGYGRILTQNRVSDATASTLVMNSLGDLQVTVNSAKGSEDVTFSFNGSNPQATATKAVVNDRIAGAVNHLTQNVLRTGVMFPLENYNDVNLVHFMDYSEGLSNATPNGVGYGFGIVGKPTPASDLPAGTATYNGGAAGYVTATADYNSGHVSDLQQFYGNTALNVDFGTNAVTGTINTFKNSDNSAIDSFAVTGNVTGNGLGISLAGNGGSTGTGTGTFFGPAGNEVGGQFTTNYTGTVSPNGIVSYNGTLTHDGVFWGAR